ncbi:hypothetical protein SDC9_130234 [bioreactor metagenome]|uniref:Uncharacterized protein n=1 Tax=bioreactor metagenome TaxID=1076179 RepID=A0A645D1X2_9ZZZZ
MRHFKVFRQSRHDVQAFQTGHAHMGGAQAFGGDGHIHGHTAAADDQHALANMGRLFKLNVEQEFQARF